MFEFLGAVAIMFVILALNSHSDNSTEKYRKGKLNEYNGEKDDPNTDNTFPW